MAAASACCVALGNWCLTSVRGTALDCWEPIGHPDHGPEFSDFDCARQQGVLFQGLGFRYQSQRRSSANSKKTTFKIVVLRRFIDTQMEEETNETS
jgi:hypothetical protein